jgi:hypothetical protein
MRIHTTFVFVDLELAFPLLHPGWLAGWLAGRFLGTIFVPTHQHLANSRIPKAHCLWVLVVIEELGVVGSTP